MTLRLAPLHYSTLLDIVLRFAHHTITNAIKCNCNCATRITLHDKYNSITLNIRKPAIQTLALASPRQPSPALASPRQPSPALRFGSPLSLCTGCWEAIFHDQHGVNGFGDELSDREMHMENGTPKCWLTLIGDIWAVIPNCLYLQTTTWPENAVRSCAKMTPPRVAIHPEPSKGFISGQSSRFGWRFHNQSRGSYIPSITHGVRKHSMGWGKIPPANVNP